MKTIRILRKKFLPFLLRKMSYINQNSSLRPYQSFSNSSRLITLINSTAKSVSWHFYTD